MEPNLDSFGMILEVDLKGRVLGSGLEEIQMVVSLALHASVVYAGNKSFRWNWAAEIC